MQLVKEIRNDVLDSSKSLTDALRRAKVLAASLGNQTFSEWVDRELNGYPDEGSVPDYRKVRLIVTGTLSGLWGSGLNNVSVPLFGFSDDQQEKITTKIFEGGIGVIESMIKSIEGGVVAYPWNGNMVGIYNSVAHKNPDLALVGAQGTTSVAAIEGIVDSVRNRLLEFMLELQQISSDILEADEADLMKIPKEAVNNAISIAIHGGTNAIASGSGFTQKVHQQVVHNDQSSLFNVLRENGVEQADLDELREAIEADGEPKDKQIGPRVQGWMGKMLLKAGQGIWKVGTEAASKILTDGLLAYYALGPAMGGV